MRSTHLALVSILIFIYTHRVARVQASTFVGCFGDYQFYPPEYTADTPDPHTGGYGYSVSTDYLTSPACAAHCGTYGWTYSVLELGVCSCVDNPPPQYFEIFPAAGPNGGCPDIYGYEVYDVPTDFNLVQCYATATALTQALVPVDTPEDCFAQCKTFTYAYFIPSQSSGTIECACGDATPKGSSATCGDQVYFVYDHTPLPMGSALKRRTARRAAVERSRQEAETLCPWGMTACVIPGATGAFECLDTQEELESCGGCVFGGVDPATPLGTDCTHLPGIEVGAVTCHRGRCDAVSCVEGYGLVKGRCVRSWGMQMEV